MTLGRRSKGGNSGYEATLFETTKCKVFEICCSSFSRSAYLAFSSPFPRRSFSKAFIGNPLVRTATCPTLRLSSVQACARFMRSSEHQNQVLDIETRLRSLGARYAADQAQSAFCEQDANIPETWAELLSVLYDHECTNVTLSRIASKLGIISLLRVSPASASKLFHLFDKSLMLSIRQQMRILSTKPDILEMDVSLISATLQALFNLGMPLRHVQRIALIFPYILMQHPSSIARVARFLQSSPLSFPDYKVRSFLYRSPWIFTVDIDTRMAPTVDWLSEFIGQTSDLTKLVLSAPAVLGTRRASLHSVMRLLEVEVHLKEEDRISIINRHPRILTCSPEKQLRPTLNFLRYTLRIGRSERRKIVRAFPHILTLDIDQQIMPVVDFFIRRGASDVSRLVRLFPPILSNDLHTDTIPKVEYFTQKLGLSMDEVLKFPACFSYDLTSRIIPRTRFVQKMGCSMLDFNLRLSIAPSDKEFCEFLQVELHHYASFSEACMKEIHDSSLADKAGTGEEHQKRGRCKERMSGFSSLSAEDYSLRGRHTRSHNRGMTPFSVYP